LEFNLSSLAAVCDEQYESIPDDEIALLARKFRALHKFHKERSISPRRCFEYGDTTHFIIDCPKRKKFNSSNNYDYTNRNDSSNKGCHKKNNCFGDKKKKFQNIMSRACCWRSISQQNNPQAYECQLYQLSPKNIPRVIQSTGTDVD
jgi:hypothetical protein